MLPSNLCEKKDRLTSLDQLESVASMNRVTAFGTMESEQFQGLMTKGGPLLAARAQWFVWSAAMDHADEMPELIGSDSDFTGDESEEELVAEEKKNTKADAQKA
jgi:hypothetical protein